MTRVNISEFRNNLKYYSEIAKTDDIEVFNRDEVVFYIQSLKNKKAEAFKRLDGIIKSDIPYEVILKERLKEL